MVDHFSPATYMKKILAVKNQLRDTNILCLCSVINCRVNPPTFSKRVRNNTYNTLDFYMNAIWITIFSAQIVTVEDEINTYV